MQDEMSSSSGALAQERQPYTCVPLRIDNREKDVEKDLAARTRRGDVPAAMAIVGRLEDEKKKKNIMSVLRPSSVTDNGTFA